MIGLSRRQAKILQNQISRMYGRHYIALRTSDSALSIGDILSSTNDINPLKDSSVLDSSSLGFSEGTGRNQNITSSSSMSFSTKIAGKADPGGMFELAEAGISVTFSSENDLFLKFRNLRQRTLDDFVGLRNEILQKFTRGDLEARVHIVRGLVLADKYFMQFGANKSGSIGFNIDANFPNANASAEADFDLKWQNEVGIFIDGSAGGVLAYRVSGVRLRRHLRPPKVKDLILAGMSEPEALDTLTLSEKADLVQADALDVFDVSSELVSEED